MHTKKTNGSLEFNIPKEYSPDDTFFRTVLESLDDYVVFTTDKEGFVTSWNSGAEKILGYTEKEIIGKSAFLFFIPEDRAKKAPEKELNRALKEGSSRNERWHLRKDGSRFWGFGKVFPLKDSSGHIYGFTKIMRDFTSQKKMTEELEISKKRFQSMIEHSTDGIALSDQHGKYFYISSAIKKLLGYTPNEFLELNRGALIHPDDLKNLDPKLRSKLNKPNAMINLQIRALHKNGTWRWFEVTSTNLLHDPNVHAFITNFRDITDRKLSEQKLREHAALLQIANDAFIVLNKDNRVMFWSKGAKRLYGWSEKEALGKIAYELLQTEFPTPLLQIQKKLKKRKSWQGEIIHTKKNGEKVTIDSQWELLENTSGFYFLEVNRDITERKRIEQQKNDFVSIATHELKTPVTSIKAYTQVLQRRFEKNNDLSSANQLAKMDAQIDKLSSLISDLLDVTKIESGRLQLHQEYFDFDKLITNTAEELQRTTEKHKLILKGKSNKKLYGDSDRIGQVITNLISNAIKYSPYSDKIILQSKSNSTHITFCVQDFGVGIPKEKQPKVFERFYRVSGPKENTFPGIGLGLYISDQFIRRMHGRLWVESVQGEGATFCFMLPIHGAKSKTKNDLVEEEIKHE